MRNYKMIISGKLTFVPTIITLIGIFSSCYGETTDDKLKKLATANNMFGLNTYKSLSVGADSNVFFSPLSLSKELRQTLGYNDVQLTEKDVHSSFLRLLSRISTGKSYTLRSANTILVNSRLYLRPEFKKGIRETYLSPVDSADFAKDGQRIVEGVNNWVGNRTGGMIRQVLKDVDAETAMIMLNTVYFKGKWKSPFKRRETRMADFFNNGLSASKKVQMMQQKSIRFPYAESSDFQAVELPYEGEDLSMLVLLPKTKSGLPSLEQNLTAAKLQEIRQKLAPKKIDLYLPKFTFEFQKNLRSELQDLGLLQIFRGGTEDFSGMTSEADSRLLSVSQVIHKSKVEVNEEGTRAAAATGVLIIPVGLLRNTIFRANHPFLFFIIKKTDGLILFMGRVSKL